MGRYFKGVLYVNVLEMFMHEIDDIDSAKELWFFIISGWMFKMI